MPADEKLVPPGVLGRTASASSPAVQSLACHRHSSSSTGTGHDKLSHEKKKPPAELHRKSRKRSGAWELNGCSRSGPFSWQAQKMKGAQENSVLLLTEQWIKANKGRQNSIKTCAGACIIIVLSYLMLCQNPLPLSPGASHRQHTNKNSWIDKYPHCPWVTFKICLLCKETNIF